jgi:hypothetical protein
MKVLLLVVFISLFFSCATSFQPKGLSGGYEKLQLDENLFSVNFSGNGYTRSQRATDFYLLRCAETTKDNGFKFFTIVNQNNNDYSANINT